MSAPEALEVTSWDAFPAEALERVVAFVTTDVLALCAVTCVSRAWRDAAERVEPQFAVRLTKMPPAVAQRLTDAGLAALVRRARGRLEYLDLCGASQITDEGFAAALLQPHALTAFHADMACFLSAEGVARALAPQRGRMRELYVRGLDCTHNPPPDAGGNGYFWNDECRRVEDELRALLGPRGLLSGDVRCSARTEFSGDKHCVFMCGPEDTCQECGLARCSGHNNGHFDECSLCGRCFCTKSCMHGSVCERCADEEVPEGPYEL